LATALGYLAGVFLGDIDGSWADSNHRFREGGHRRLGCLICCSREFPNRRFSA
jgi:hypothetical protein